MITFIRANNNTSINSTIENYYCEIDSLQSYNMKCSCGIAGNVIKYGSYKRKIIIKNKVYIIKIQRIYCKHCKKTHAIIPEFIIPYERLSLIDYIIAACSIRSKNEINTADYELKRIYNNYHYWLRIKRSVQVKVKNLRQLIIIISNNFSLKYLQNPVKRQNTKLNEVSYNVLSLPT